MQYYRKRNNLLKVLKSLAVWYWFESAFHDLVHLQLKDRQEVMQPKSPILLKFGSNVGFGEKMFVPKQEVKIFYFLQVKETPSKMAIWH